MRRAHDQRLGRRKRGERAVGTAQRRAQFLAPDPVFGPMRDEIEAVGGKIAGVVVNRSTYNPPAFLRRLTG